ncbi:MAG: CotH kinase family protein, partial [Flavobacteriales bacterium]
IRYKGFSSASVDRTKNPFNIKLNYSNDESYQGIDKIKLSNVIQDPSFLREVMSYEIARNYMPAPRANFAKVYVNDVYWGLYTNVEAVNKDFISDHFNSSDGALFKGNPEDLDLFGENSNLSDSPGEAETNYHDLYKMESDIGWSNLLELINTLNQNPENVEAVLNVDRALWMHAFNYSLINYDSYVGYAQNYYIYQDINNQFNPLLWDLNMSFGSFRLTDDSDYFDGFSIEQAKVSDPLAHLNSFSVFDRPLMRELFNNSTFKRMYLAHMRTIMEQNVASNWLEDQGLFYQDIIATHVLADTNKFYSYEDFENNLYSTVTDLTTYPGLTDLMNDRWDYLEDYPGITNSPNIISVVPNSTTPVAGLTILFSAEIENTDEAWLYYRVSGSGTFTNLPMLDDGQNGDEFANDGIFSVEMTSESNAIDYYVYSQNEEAGKFSPEEAAYKFDFIGTPIDAGDLVINELMSSNATSASDNNGDYDDWIELYNTTANSISTAGMFLSDDFENPEKWVLPTTEIPANSYFIIWADEESEQGSVHSNFQLSSLGEQLLLSYNNGFVIDSLTFGPLATDQSFARFPNGTGPFVEMNTTFNA